MRGRRRRGDDAATSWPGGIFGALLAMEGLLAFFAESTFIALWIVIRGGVGDELVDRERAGRYQVELPGLDLARMD